MATPKSKPYEIFFWLRPRVTASDLENFEWAFFVELRCHVDFTVLLGLFTATVDDWFVAFVCLWSRCCSATRQGRRRRLARLSTWCPLTPSALGRWDFTSTWSGPFRLRYASVSTSSGWSSVLQFLLGSQWWSSWYRSMQSLLRSRSLCRFAIGCVQV